jgi:hypothetical protein
MSISTLGAGPSSFGTTYNFTNVTNAQFQQEVDSLGQQGKLSPDQQILLTASAEGADSIPVSGPRQTPAQALSDPTTHDFLMEYQNADYELHHTPGLLVGPALVDSILQTLQTLSGQRGWEFTDIRFENGVMPGALLRCVGATERGVGALDTWPSTLGPTIEAAVVV